MLIGAGTAWGQLRIVTYNVAGLNGNQAALEDVFEALNDDDKVGFAVAPALYVFQEVHSGDESMLGIRLNAAAPAGITYAQGTYTNYGESSGAQAMFYRTDLLVEDVSGHADIFTQATRYTDRWRLELVGYDSPDASFYIYSSHLKASTGSTNQQLRLAGVTAIRNNADALGSGTHIIYAGDMNFYSNSEPGYAAFLTAGAGQAFDPLGTGYWGGSSNAIKHSQSPCLSDCPLIGGGLDDRFDFQLVTAEFNDGEGLARMSGAYRSFGNDGLHYDNSINVGTNSYYPADIPRSNALADLLFAASDHIPVIHEYQVPAMMTASLQNEIGRLIQGVSRTVGVLIGNDAEAVISSGADELDFTASGSGALSGLESGTVPALGAAVSVELTVDTSVAGPVVGTATVSSTSEAAQGGPIELETSGEVLRPSNASFSSGSDLDSVTVTTTGRSGSGMLEIEIDLYNFGFDPDQALLDVDSVSELEPPFSYVSGLQSGVGGEPALLVFAFTTGGLEAGSYAADVTIGVSDEDVLGEASSELYAHLEVRITNPSVPAASDWGAGLAVLMLLIAGSVAVRVKRGCRG